MDDGEGIAREGESDPPLGRAFLRVMRAIMFDDPPVAELDALPLAQLRLLWTVHFQADATMKDYSERLGVSQSTVTQLADRLVRRGLVERQTDPTDRRVVRLHVSEPGSRLLAEANATRHQTFLAIWGRMSAEDRAAALHGLERLGDAAEGMRADQGRPLPSWSERHEAEESGYEQAGGASQPVVDLMARRVRGRSAS